MIECKNPHCGRLFEADRKCIHDVLMIEKFNNESFNNVIDYVIEIKCPYCEMIFPLQIGEYFRIRHADDLARIERITKRANDGG